MGRAQIVATIARDTSPDQHENPAELDSASLARVRPGTAELHDDPDGKMRDRIAVKHGFPGGTAFALRAPNG